MSSTSSPLANAALKKEASPMSQSTRYWIVTGAVGFLAYVVFKNRCSLSDPHDATAVNPDDKEELENVEDARFNKPEPESPLDERVHHALLLRKLRSGHWTRGV